MSRPIPLPVAAPDEILCRHDLLLDRGVYLVRDDDSYYVAVVIASGTGRFIVRHVTGLEYGARTHAVSDAAYAALDAHFPPRAPQLSIDR